MDSLYDDQLSKNYYNYYVVEFEFVKFQSDEDKSTYFLKYSQLYIINYRIIYQIIFILG